MGTGMVGENLNDPSVDTNLEHQLEKMSSEDQEIWDDDAATIFFSKYEPKEVLGRGLTSLVKRCVCKETGIEYAVKIMDVTREDRDAEGNDMKALVQREIDTIRRVSGHPNVVSLHDAYESDTFVFLVFELVKNGELFDFLTDRVRLTEKRARLLMKQILTAVHHCHTLNVVHRDVKPENILLDEDYNAKLTDFGFARICQPDEMLYEVCGTPGYLAPELLRAGMLERDEHPGYSFSVDMWACGVIYYTMLVGRPPFWHRKQYTLLRMICSGNYCTNSPEWDTLTEESKDFIRLLLNPDPTQRLSALEAMNHQVFTSNRPQLTRSDSLLNESQILDNQKQQNKNEQQSQDVVDNSSATNKVSTTEEKESKLSIVEVKTEDEQQKDVPMEEEPRPSTSPKKTPPPKFNPRLALRVGMICVRFLVRFRRLKETPEPLSLSTCQTNPYQMRVMRKIIDQAAFGVYSHWVKKGEGQNRAALFEHLPKKEGEKNKAKQKLLNTPTARKHGHGHFGRAAAATAY